jgi:hypothetical protein
MGFGGGLRASWIISWSMLAWLSWRKSNELIPIAGVIQTRRRA